MRAGRHLFDGKDPKVVLQKLEEAFSLDCTDKEACFYAEISTSALYEYQKRNPEFLERKSLLKAKLILLARKNIVNHLGTDIALAKWYLEKKCPEEFGKQPVEPSNIIPVPAVSFSEDYIRRLAKYNPEEAERLRCC